MADAFAARHVVFVGPMGSGKTTIGRRVAEALGRNFLDNDERLERATGESAAALADRDGADALHRVEAEVLLDALRTTPPAVITAAASTITDEGVRTALSRRAWVAWLRADPASLAARLPESRTRPFRDADPSRLVAAQAAERDALFATAADASFDTDDTDVDHVVASVLTAVRRAETNT